MKKKVIGIMAAGAIGVAIITNATMTNSPVQPTPTPTVVVTQTATPSDPKAQEQPLRQQEHRRLLRQLHR